MVRDTEYEEGREWQYQTEQKELNLICHRLAKRKRKKEAVNTESEEAHRQRAT
jgi:hypothetical protein